MTNLERLAVQLYGHLWYNIGTTDDWPIQVCGDDGEVTELIRLLNEVQNELKLRGYANQLGATYMYQE